MKESHLLIWASVVAVFGFIVLLLAKPDVSPQHFELRGNITGVRERGTVTFVEFVPNNLEVVGFGGLVVEEGEAVLVGRLQPYRGRVEFVIDEVR